MEICLFADEVRRLLGYKERREKGAGYLCGAVTWRAVMWRAVMCSDIESSDVESNDVKNNDLERSH